MTLKALLLALMALPISKEDLPATDAKRSELEAIGAAVYRESGGNLEVMAMTLSLGFYESSYSSRIGRSECKPLECDPIRKHGKIVGHRARGWFQLHQNGLSDEQWEALKGPGSLDAQVKEATRRVRSAFATCKGEPDVVRAAIAQFAGAGCKGMHRVSKFTERLQTYYRVRSRIP